MSAYRQPIRHKRLSAEPQVRASSAHLLPSSRSSVHSAPTLDANKVNSQWLGVCRFSSAERALLDRRRMATKADGGLSGANSPVSYSPASI